MSRKSKPLIVIVGSTGTGKSSLAISLAQSLSGEIINADSVSIRKFLDVGSSKPTKQEQVRVKHHLIDVVGPNDEYNVSMFQKDAYQAIERIQNNDKLAFLVGGTGLYIDSVLYNYSFNQISSRSERSSLNKMTLVELWEYANKLGLSLAKVDKYNPRRLTRLIESNGQLPTKNSLRDNCLIIGIRISKDNLKINIEKRLDRMLANGLEKEVNNLAKTYGWGSESLRAIGYKEWQDYFVKARSLEDTRALIISNSLKLAKKQTTWFKRNKSILWLEYPVNEKYVAEIITTFTNK